MKIKKFIDGLSPKKRITYFVLGGIIVGFLPWILFTLFLRDNLFINEALIYGFICIVVGALGGIFYNKNKNLFFPLVLIFYLIFLLMAIRQLIVIMFFVGLGPWSLG